MSNEQFRKTFGTGLLSYSNAPRAEKIDRATASLSTIFGTTAFGEARLYLVLPVVTRRRIGAHSP